MGDIWTEQLKQIIYQSSLLLRREEYGVLKKTVKNQTFPTRKRLFPSSIGPDYVNGNKKK